MSKSSTSTSHEKPGALTESMISDCLAFIAGCQNEDGSFDSLSGNADFSVASRTVTPFITGLILICLSPLKDHPAVRGISQKSISFLLSLQEQASSAAAVAQASGKARWTWNYWPPQSRNAKESPIPDDLDDTFTILAAIQIHSPGVMCAEAIAAAVQALMQAEIKPGGPYNTWIVGDISIEPWKDIDPVVNAAVSFFLKMLNVSLPAIDSLIDEFITGKSYKTKYYSTYHSSLYFASRSYDGSMKKDASDYILDQQQEDGGWGNALATSMCLSALIRFGHEGPELDRAASNLMRHFSSSPANKEGVPPLPWKPYPCYVEQHKDIPVYAGSAALTAAFALEALLFHRNRTDSRTDAQAKGGLRHASIEADRIEKTILSMVTDGFRECGPHTRELARKTLARILEKDSLKQITLLPWHARESISPAKSQEVTLENLILAGSASVFGWIAYTLYDDVLDEEADPSVLSCANISSRIMMETYLSLVPKKIWPAFRKILDDIDEANCRERISCKMSKQANQLLIADIPDYASLSALHEKSLGHAIGPLLVLAMAGYGPETQEFLHMTDFFRHYLAARQLNDDAHDWQADLERGFLNSVSSRIYAEHFKTGKAGADMGKLQLIFWNTIIDRVANDIFTHVQKAENLLERLSVLTDTSYFKAMLHPLRAAASSALRERDVIRALADVKSGTSQEDLA